jgi:hypothetical protein
MSNLALSFCLLFVVSALALEWADIGNGTLALAALAAVIFLSVLKAWLDEDQTDRPLPS